MQTVPIRVSLRDRRLVGGGKRRPRGATPCGRCCTTVSVARHPRGQRESPLCGDGGGRGAHRTDHRSAHAPHVRSAEPPSSSDPRRADRDRCPRRGSHGPDHVRCLCDRLERALAQAGGHGTTLAQVRCANRGPGRRRPIPPRGCSVCRCQTVVNACPAGRRVRLPWRAVIRGRIFGGWGTWIRTRTRGVRVHRSTVKLSPNRPEAGSSRLVDGSDQPRCCQRRQAWAVR